MSIRFLLLSIIYYCSIIVLININNNNNVIAQQASIIFPSRFTLERVVDHQRYIATAAIHYYTDEYSHIDGRQISFDSLPAASDQIFRWENIPQSSNNNNNNNIGKLYIVGDVNHCVSGSLTTPNSGITLIPADNLCSDSIDGRWANDVAKLLWTPEPSPGSSSTIRFRHPGNNNFCLTWGGPFPYQHPSTGNAQGFTSQLCIDDPNSFDQVYKIPNILQQQFTVRDADTITVYRPVPNEEFIIQWSPLYLRGTNQKVRRIVEMTYGNDMTGVYLVDYDGINNNRKLIWTPNDNNNPNGVGKIKLSSRNQCLDQWVGDINNGALVGSYDCTTGGQSFQQWKIRNNRMIQYASSPSNQEKCLKVENDAHGARLRLFDCDDNDAYQQFDFVPKIIIPLPSLINNDQFIIQWTGALTTGGVVSRYLFDSSSTPDNAFSGNTINLSLFDSTINTVNPGNRYTWIVTDSVTGIGKIKSSKNNLCYDLPYGRTNNGNAITMYDCTGGGQANQQWKFRTINNNNNNNNNHRMIQYGSSTEEKCLGVDAAATPATIKLFDCNQNDPKQLFDIL